MSGREEVTARLDLAEVIRTAIDDDFVEVFPGEPDDPGYASMEAFAAHVAEALAPTVEALVAEAVEAGIEEGVDSTWHLKRLRADWEADAWTDGWNAAVDSDGFPGDVNPYRTGGCLNPAHRCQVCGWVVERVGHNPKSVACALLSDPATPEERS